MSILLNLPNFSASSAISSFNVGSVLSSIETIFSKIHIFFSSDATVGFNNVCSTNRLYPARLNPFISFDAISDDMIVLYSIIAVLTFRLLPLVPIPSKLVNAQFLTLPNDENINFNSSSSISLWIFFINIFLVSNFTFSSLFNVFNNNDWTCSLAATIDGCNVNALLLLLLLLIVEVGGHVTFIVLPLKL